MDIRARRSRDNFSGHPVAALNRTDKGSAKLGRDPTNGCFGTRAGRPILVDSGPAGFGKPSREADISQPPSVSSEPLIPRRLYSRCIGFPFETPSKGKRRRGYDAALSHIRLLQVAAVESFRFVDGGIKGQPTLQGQ